MNEKTKTEEPKVPREERRLRQQKAEILDTLLNLFLTERSACVDPNGEEADKAYVKYRNMWLQECHKFNKTKNRQFTLRGSAFKDNVEILIEKEKVTQEQLIEKKKEADFQKWLKKQKGKLSYTFLQVLYWIITFGSKKKQTDKWRKRYGKDRNRAVRNNLFTKGKLQTEGGR